MSKSADSDPQKATISDVARMAGVSIKTVSRVANKEAAVRETTRIRVQEIIDRLGYEANPYARYLGSLRRPTGVDLK
ncbi:MAG: LacI family DNA-binding transcriptional regulator [Gammaproteobacteria bacterium]|nr:LacI family DNA-binding transcriptional regulator [Gammaproteobacteria bacterium]